MKIILQSCQEIHLNKFPISGINNLSANLLTRSRNNPTSERVPILPSMATDFREFADDRRSWLTRDCSCCVWGGKDPGHGIDLSSSQTDTGSNYRRFELAVFLRPTRICSRSRPTSQPHDSPPLHDLPRLIFLLLIEESWSPPREESPRSLWSLFGGRGFSRHS